MSFLTPLYIAGALAAALPVLFHLIRRTPRGQTPFSSLMFLSPSPPRITRRSRIEHWLLLALRAGALVLLAAAFARPFWRTSAERAEPVAAAQRVAIVVDVSASMRRGDLWQQVAAAVDDALAQCRPQDEAAVLTCGDALRPLATFAELTEAGPARRRALVARRLADSGPGWTGAWLGQGLLEAANLVNDSRDATETLGRAQRRVVLVSDMAAGSRVQDLGEAPWPEGVELELRPVVPAGPTNAGLARLADESPADRPRGDAGPARLRVRVANAAQSQSEEFALQWLDSADQPVGEAIDVYVPPGESRVVRLDPPPAGADQPRLTLHGDDHDFDNALYVVTADRGEAVVVYLGDEAADDAQGLRYYLQQAVAADPQRAGRVVPWDEAGPLLAARTGAPPLVTAVVDPSAEQADLLRRHVDRGGAVLSVLTDAGSWPGMAALWGVDALEVDEAPIDDFALLADVDFSHPLFAPMAGPRFNDFTRIRFWRHRRLPAEAVDRGRVIARFDDGDPALVEQRRGRGRLLLATVGWHPRDGQWARSWKFLLMMQALLGGADAERALPVDAVAGQTVSLPRGMPLAEAPTLTRPDGSQQPLPADARRLTGLDAPGYYAISGVEGPALLAVNVDPAETETSPLPAEAFEQLGAPLAGRPRPAADEQRLAQLRDVELESRQRWWQWLLAVVLGLLAAETWLAGRLSHRLDAPLTPA